MDERTHELARLLNTIDIAEPMFGTADSAVRNVVYANLVGNILSRFAQFLAENAESLPSKAYCLELLSKAIDLAFTSLSRPVIAGLLKPLVKQYVLDAAGRLYDLVMTPVPTRIEV